MIWRALLLTVLTVGGWLGLVALQGGQILGRVPQGPGCRVSYVYDGDTVALDCGTGRELTARLVGLDTPETKEPGCDAELALGKRATLRLRALVDQGPVRLSRVGVDKYRRPLMRMWIGPSEVAEVMVQEGLAVAYRGGARIDWCQKLGAT